MKIVISNEGLRVRLSGVHKSLDSILSTDKMLMLMLKMVMKKIVKPGKGNTSFSPSSVTGYVPHTPRRAPHSGLVNLHKTDSTIFFFL